jgi:Zn-dependent protease with chaperone function
VGIAALVLLAAALQVWGIPLLARAVAAHAPWSVDEALGRAAVTLVDEQLMSPSKLPEAAQARVRTALDRAVAASGQVYPPWQLVFRSSRIGPNALALPGGTLIMTDELVELLQGDTDVVVAVLAHELGHVRHRHGLRAVVQVGVLRRCRASCWGTSAPCWRVPRC